MDLTTLAMVSIASLVITLIILVCLILITYYMSELNSINDKILDIISKLLQFEQLNHPDISERIAERELFDIERKKTSKSKELEDLKKLKEQIFGKRKTKM